MKLISYISAAILSIASLEAFSVNPSHQLSRRADQDLGRCLIANNEKYGWCEKGINCPPCWVKQGDNLTCYDYKSGTTCETWEGMFDRTKTNDMSTCLIANNDKYGWCTAGVKCPPCWIKKDNRLACFDYIPGTQKCDAWEGMFDRTRTEDLSRCVIANNDNFGWCEKGINCPPCWVKMDNRLACFDYKEGTTCNKWEGMFDRTKLTNKYPAPTCVIGTNGVVCDTKKDNCPPCWSKRGEEYDCFNYTKANVCPWDGMIDTGRV